MIDSGYTSDGIFAPPPAYLQEVVRRAHAAGAGFVADEVQAGHGRTGEHLWSFTASGVVPDVVTLGKPMGNGYPVAAVLLRSDIAAAMAERTTYFSTFGGNPVACAAALAVLDVIEEQQLVENARVVGAYLRGLLEELAARREAIGDVRGRGLLIGVELVVDRETREPDGALARSVVNHLREMGVLVGRSGKADSALKIRPPLVFEARARGSARDASGRGAGGARGLRRPTRGQTRRSPDVCFTRQLRSRGQTRRSQAPVSSGSRDRGVRPGVRQACI